MLVTVEENTKIMETKLTLFNLPLKKKTVLFCLVDQFLYVLCEWIFENNRDNGRNVNENVKEN